MAIQISFSKDDRNDRAIPLSYLAITLCLRSEWSNVFHVMLNSETLWKRMTKRKKERLERITESDLKDFGGEFSKLSTSINYAIFRALTQISSNN